MDSILASAREARLDLMPTAWGGVKVNKDAAGIDEQTPTNILEICRGEFLPGCIQHLGKGKYRQND